MIVSSWIESPAMPRSADDMMGWLRRAMRQGTTRLFGAGEAALEAVPFIVVAGLVAFAPLGEAMAGAGVLAAFLGAAIVSAFAAALADRHGLVAGPSVGMALIIAGAVQALTAQAALTPGAAVAIAMALTVGCGLCLAAFASLGVGRLAPVVPYPVLAGLRNGTAVLLVIEQVHPALGLPETGPGAIHPGAIVVTAITALAMLLPIPRLHAVPAVVRALLAGVAAHHLLALLPGSAALVGPLMMPDAHHAVRLPGLAAEFSPLLHLPLTETTQILLPALLSMAVLSLLETVASASALQSETGLRSSGRRDLLAVALANIAGGALGALPAAGSLEETLDEAEAASRRSRSAAILRSAALLAIGLLAIPLLARLPAAVIAGIIIVAGIKVADPASLRELATNLRGSRRHRIEAIGNLLVFATVAAVAIGFGLVIAVFAGMLLSLLVFVVDMARGPVRRQYASPIGRSRARRGEAESAVLLREGKLIEVIELQGALFFGSTDQVAGQIEHRLSAGARYLVLDMQRVQRMDLSAARGLLGTCERHWRAGHWLVLAGMRPGVPAWDYLHDRALHTRLPPGRGYPALEDALEAAEAQLLRDLGAAHDAVLQPADALAGLGIPPDAIAALSARMHETTFPPGAIIAHAGEQSRALFILLQGRVDVCLRVAGAAAHTTRVATLAPGVMFGEMAPLTQAPRTADLLANGAVRCLRLDLEDLASLRAEHPQSAWHLLRAVALQIDMNLRLANAAIASYEE